MSKYEDYFKELSSMQDDIHNKYGAAGDAVSAKYRNFFVNHPNAIKYLTRSESTRAATSKDHDLHGAMQLLNTPQKLPIKLYTTHNKVTYDPDMYYQDGRKKPFNIEETERPHHIHQQTQPIPKKPSVVPIPARKPKIVIPPIAKRPKSLRELHDDSLQTLVNEGLAKNVDVNSVVSGIHKNVSKLSQTQIQSLTDKQKQALAAKQNKFTMKPKPPPVPVKPPMGAGHAADGSDAGEISGSSAI